MAEAEMENENPKKSSYSIAFRANELSYDDLETIYAINKIAMNVSFMTERLKGE